MITKKKEFSTENPHFKKCYKHLTPEAKADLHRLEEIEKLVRLCLKPDEPHDRRPLTYLAGLYLDFNVMSDSEPGDPKMAVYIANIHLQLAKMEPLIVNCKNI